MLELADLLASPEGGGYDIVVPSLPVFGLSSVPVRMDVRMMAGG